jgi:hypothetical protein
MSSAWNSLFMFGRCSCVDFSFQGNLGVGGDIGWPSVLLPDVQIPSGIWWTIFTSHTICNVSLKYVSLRDLTSIFSETFQILLQRSLECDLLQKFLHMEFIFCGVT